VSKFEGKSRIYNPDPKLKRAVTLKVTHYPSFKHSVIQWAGPVWTQSSGKHDLSHNDKHISNTARDLFLYRTVLVQASVFLSEYSPPKNKEEPLQIIQVLLLQNTVFIL